MSWQTQYYKTPICTGQMLQELNCSCLMTCDKPTKRESVNNLRMSTHLHVRIATKTFICLMGAILKGKGSKRTACKCKQIFDTHRKHWTWRLAPVKYRLSSSQNLSSQDLSVQSYQYKHADMAVMPSCKNTLIP